MYTDGASNDHGAGYSWVAFEKGMENPIQFENKPLGITSPYQAELFAIKSAMIWLNSNPQKLKEWGNIEILSDSKQAILSLKSIETKNTMIEDILNILKEIKKQCKNWLKMDKGSFQHKRK